MKMFLQFSLILFILGVANYILYDSYKRKKQDEEAELTRLKQRLKAKGTPEDEIDENDLREEIEPKQKYSWIFGIVICLDIWIFGAVITHLWAYFFFDEVDDSNSKRALFGDSFGAVNALISAFAFAGMIVAFILQRYELRLQRKELKDNRKEMERQTSQYKKQNLNLEIQRFETTFFNMLTLQQQIVDALTPNNTEKVRVFIPQSYPSYKDEPVDHSIHGRNMFFHTYTDILHAVQDKETKEYKAEVGMCGVLEHAGFGYYGKVHSPAYFDHYFRHFYRILKFIKENENWLKPEDQYRYACILRASLSHQELVWVYYNGLSKYGNKKLKPLLEEFCMLKNLRKSLLSLSKENADRLSELGLQKKDLLEQRFTGTDFEFNLTDQKGDLYKYHYTAFYREYKFDEANDIIRRWKEFIPS